MISSCDYDISVIIPIYNVEEYLRPCLDSMMRQGPVSLQVIMIDDGSPDKSGMIADEYADKYSNFIAFHIPNGGQGNARNFGVKHARGKYIAFLDSDDIIPDGTYSKMFRIAERDGSDITLCNMARFNSQRYYLSSLHNRVFQPLGDVAHIKTDYSLVYDTCSTNKLIDRAFYLENDFTCPSGYLYEDIPFSIHMLLAANKVSVFHDIGYLWREREGEIKSVTQQISDNKNLRDRIIAIEETNRHYAEYDAGEGVLAAWRHKNLINDFMIFLNLCTTLSDEHVLETMSIVTEYVDSHMKESDFAHLSPLIQKKYEAVFNRDVEHLRKLREFELSDEYLAIEVYEDGDRLMAKLPSDLFGAQAIDVTEAAGQKLLQANITDMEMSCEGLSIEIEFIRNRPQIRPEIISAEICLFNEVSLQTIPLTIAEINYNCVRAVLNADPGKILPLTNEPFRFRYKVTSKHFTNTGFLRIFGRASRSVRNSPLFYDDRIVYLYDSPLRYPSLQCRDNSILLKQFSIDSTDIIVGLNSPEIPVRLLSSEEEYIECPASEGAAHGAVIDTYGLPVDSECSVFANEPAGFGDQMIDIPVLTDQKKLKTHRIDSGVIVVNTLRTGELRLTRHEHLTKVSELTVSDSSLSITAGFRGFKKKSRKIDHFEIVAIDPEEMTTSVLAISEGLLPSEEVAFEISSGKLREVAADIENALVISIRAVRIDGSSVILPLYHFKKLSEQFEFGDEVLKVFRNIHGQLVFRNMEQDPE